MRVTIALRSSPLIGPKSTTACSPTKQAYTSTTIAPAVLRDRLVKIVILLLNKYQDMI